MGQAVQSSHHGDWTRQEAPLRGLTGWSPQTEFYWDRPFTDLVWLCSRWILFVFVINIFF